MLDLARCFHSSFIVFDYIIEKNENEKFEKKEKKIKINPRINNSKYYNSKYCNSKYCTNKHFYLLAIKLVLVRHVAKMIVHQHWLVLLPMYSYQPNPFPCYYTY